MRWYFILLHSLIMPIICQYVTGKIYQLYVSGLNMIIFVIMLQSRALAIGPMIYNRPI